MALSLKEIEETEKDTWKEEVKVEKVAFENLKKDAGEKEPPI